MGDQRWARSGGGADSTGLCTPVGYWSIGRWWGRKERGERGEGRGVVGTFLLSTLTYAYYCNVQLAWFFVFCCFPFSSSRLSSLSRLVRMQVYVRMRGCMYLYCMHTVCLVCTGCRYPTHSKDRTGQDRSCFYSCTHIPHTTYHIILDTGFWDTHAEWHTPRI